MAEVPESFRGVKSPLSWYIWLQTRGDRGSKLEEGSISELAKVESSQIFVVSFQENS